MEKIKYIWAYPPQSFFGKYIDVNKSKPYLDLNGMVQNKNGLPFCTKLNRNIVSIEDFINRLEKFDYEEYKILCSKCKREIAVIYVEKNTKGINGILAMKYTQHLLAYRCRMDGLLGFECICGGGDTRLGTDEKIKYPSKFPVQVKSSKFNEAKFNEKNSDFKSIKRKDK